MNGELLKKSREKWGWLAVMVWGLPLVLFSTAAFGQKLIIEGGPNGAKISNRDGKIEGPVFSAKRETITADSTTPGTVPGPQIIRPVGGSDFSIPVSSTENSVPATPKLVGKEKPDEKPAVPTIDVAKQKRINIMERELGIYKSATVSGVTYKAELIFQNSAPAINKLAFPTLEKIAGYLALADSKSISVDYKYHAAEDSSTTAKERAQALAGFLAEKSGVKREKFVVSNPKPVKKPIPRQGAYRNDISPEYKSLVTIVLHRQ